MTRKRLILGSIFGVVAIVLLSYFAVRWFSGSAEREAEDAARSIGVAIPDTATEIVSRDEGAGLAHDGMRCSDLQFLMPTAQWRQYVEPYFSSPLVATYNSSLACGRAPRECSGNKGHENGTAFEAISTGVPGTYPLEFERAVVVVPDCEPGQALVMWSTQR